jgi:hypothetical protein
MISTHIWDNRDNLPDVDLFLNVMVAQLCVDIDRENHPERGGVGAKVEEKPPKKGAPEQKK